MKTRNKDKSNQLCLSKSISLDKIPAAEQWLNHMDEQGFVLSKVVERTFYFIPKKTKSEGYFYFMQSPEKGANSSSWVYYEFLDKGGIKISHYGTSHLSPNLILKIPKEKFNLNRELYGYYFSHRNHRLYHRFVSNILLSMVFSLLGVMVIINNFDALTFTLCGGSILTGIYNGVGLVKFLRFCKLQGAPAMWKRPKRPGY